MGRRGRKVQWGCACPPKARELGACLLTGCLAVTSRPTGTHRGRCRRHERCMQGMRFVQGCAGTRTVRICCFTSEVHRAMPRLRRCTVPWLCIYMSKINWDQRLGSILGHQGSWVWAWCTVVTFHGVHTHCQRWGGVHGVRTHCVAGGCSRPVPNQYIL